MDFALEEHIQDLQADAREFLANRLAPEVEDRLYREGASHDDEFVGALREKGWVAVGWSEDGARHDPVEYHALREEMQWIDAPMYAVGTTMLVAKAIQKVGTDEQKAEILPKAVAGEVIIVLGFTEPEAGSDVANAQTRAVRDGDEWVISGSKMFTTNAHLADYAFLLTRSNVDVPKHKGLTTFLMPMDQPGIEVQPVYTIAGERTNIVYFNDARVDDTWRVGDVDGGWSVMTKALQDEHSVGYGSRIARLVDEAEAWAREPGDDGAAIDDPDVRERLARAATEAEVSRLLELRAAWMSRGGRVPEAEGPMGKLFSSEAMVRAAEDLRDQLGPDGIRSRLDETAPRDGQIEFLMRFSLGTTIYAGTSEIQRNIIASRGLGLPRA
jgi:alkylation response protein AidB-like acyl-CoA dehydrogenase